MQMLVLVLLPLLFMVNTGKAQAIIFTEDWETATDNSNVPPAGWGIDVITGSNITYFMSQGTWPTILPYSGSRLVDFESFSYSTAQNRLKRTTPISTVPFPHVSVDFEWYTDNAYSTNTDHVDVQWSTNGTSWTTAATLYRYSTLNAWVLESIALPAAAANQSTLYIGFLFTSNFGDDCHLDLVHVKGYTGAPVSPTVITTHATNITSSSATLNGQVNANGNSTTGYFEYGLTTTYGTTLNFPGAVTGNTLTAESISITGLTSLTTYHFRLVGMNAGGTTYGNDSVFATTSSLPLTPTVYTHAATTITSNSAYLNGAVNANGYSTTVTFQYGLTTSYGTTLTYGTVTGTTLTNVSKQATGLTPNTTYHFRCVGANTNGTSYGNDTTFVTLPTTYPPAVYTTGATNITATSARLNGLVNAWGSTTTVTFQYGLTSGYGTTVTYGPVNGTSAVPVYVDISGLTQNTIYHYRCVGTNVNGTSYGFDTTFLTGTPLMPTVTTTHATMIAQCNANLNGVVNANGSMTTVSFQYGLTTSYGNTANLGQVSGTTPDSVSKYVTGLTPSTVYHFRCVGSNTYGTTYGNDSLFTTLPAAAPYVVTNAATTITSTGATLNGHVNANGSPATVTFQYGLTTSYGTTVSWGTVTGSSLTAVAKSITGLTPGTLYHYRCVGVNTIGTTNGNDTTFMTSGTIPPTAVTGGVTSLTAISAILNGTVNANGTSTTVSFDYGLTTSYGNNVYSGIVTGNTMTPVNAAISALLPATLYHYRVHATNANGTANGADSIFTTLPAAPTVNTGYAYNITYNSASINGTANANGATATITFEYGLTTAYGSTVNGTPNTISGTTTQNITANLTGLTPATVYHFRIKGVNSVGTTYGADNTFMTLSTGTNPPTVITTYADFITNAYAVIHGIVNANGSSTTASFNWGTTTSYGNTVSAGTVNGTSNTPVSAYISGLAPGIWYHYRAKGVNAGGTAYGADSTFYSGDTIPTVVTNAATNITSGGATLNGTVNPNGPATSTSFEYGLTTAYGYTIAGNPGTVTGSYPHAITAALTGLISSTAYHYRAKGVNSAGTSYGADLTFITSAGTGCDAIMTWANAGPLAIQFHDVSTGNTSRAWHFGDGTTSYLTDPLHIYPSAGNYTVTLYVHNTATSCYDSTSQVVTVTDSTVNCQAQFTYLPDQNDPNTLYFIDQSTGNITNWLWNFDDDSSSVAQNPVHTFPGPGNYYVCLAIDGPSCLNTTCQEVSVGGATNCVSYFTFTTSSLTVNFTGHMYNSDPAVYYWSFGDSQTGLGHSVSHTYAAAGAYYVTLTTIDSLNNCTYSTGQTILAGDSAQYHQIYGQVYAGAFPLTAGVVTLFSVDTIPPYLPLITVSDLDSNGVYIFPMVPNGDFYIYAIPTVLNGYLPTYYDDVLNWQNATIVHLGQPNNPYTIHLIPAGTMIHGNGNIFGHINGSELKTTLVDKITMLLMDSNGNSISFNPVQTAGDFSFNSLDYGTYYLKAEMAGILSDLVKVILTPDNPNATVTLTFSKNRITGIYNLPKGINSCIIYPNPVEDIVNISFKTVEPVKVTLEIISMTGEVMLQVQKSLESGSSNLTLPVETLTSGIYTLRIKSDDGLLVVKKLVKIQ